MAFGIDTTSPQTLTFEQIEQQMLNGVLGGTPLGPLVPMMTPYLNQMLGLQGPGWRNPIMDSMVFSNMTPYGTYMSQMQNRFNRVANDALNRQSNAARRGWLENIGRTMMSFDSWKQTELGQQYAATTTDEKILRQHYEDYISNEAIGRDNWLANAGYKFLDPEGYEAARNYLSMAGANLIRNGSVAGRRSAYMQARAVGGMFLDKNGKFDFNSADYGFMNIGEASAIAAAITKDTDLFSDAGFNSAKIKEATEKLRQKVQDYTKALSPLKDIFGSDIPQMITTLENISGQKFSQMDSATMARLSSKISIGMQVGGYGIDQVLRGSMAMQETIDKMSVPFINGIGATSQALTVLNATASGILPAAMTQARYIENVRQMTVRTSNSQGAEYMNMAYAAWRNRPENKDKDFNAFKAEYDSLRQRYGADAAILQMGGAADFYQLRDLGMGSKYYAEAVREDVGGIMARQEQLNTLISHGWMQAPGESREDYMSAISAVQSDIKLLSDDNYLESSKLSEGVKEQIRRIRHGRYGQELVSGLHMMAEIGAKEERGRKHAKLQEAIGKLKVGLPESLGALVNNFISGKQSLTQVLATSELYGLADPETQGMLTQVASAIDQDMDLMGITGDARESFAKDFLTYAIENGYQNEAFTEELQKYTEAQEEMERISKGRERSNLTGEEASKWDAAHARATYASKSMLLTQYVDQSRYAEYVGTGKDADRRREAALNVFDEALRRELSPEEAGYEVEDMMTVGSIESLIKDRNYKELSPKIRETFIARLSAKAGEKGVMTLDDARGIIDEMQKSGEFGDKNSHAWNTLRDLTNIGFGREQDTGTQMRDVYDQIGKAIGEMGKLSADMQKVLQALGFEPNNNDQKPG